MATVNIYLDKRTLNKEQEHPIKVIIYSTGKQYLVSTKLFATEEIFKQAVSSKTRCAASIFDLRKAIGLAKSKAERIIEKLGASFNIDKFKRLYYNEIDHLVKSHLLPLPDLYCKYIEHLEMLHSSYKTISYHQSALKCFLVFQKEIYLQDITIEWLNQFESYMLQRHKTLVATWSYLRSLRTIYNRAIEDGIMPKESFPFGKRKYNIGATTSAKAFLYPEEIEKFKSFVPQNEAQQRAKDYWFCCYYINGIAPVDLLQLTKNNIRGKHIIFERQKTKKSKSEGKQIAAYIHKEIRLILARQGNEKPNPYLFPVLKPDLNPKDKVAVIDTWKRLTNRVLNRIGVKLQLHIPLNLYVARHSWATMMKLNNVSVHDISDGLGHSSIRQTSNYLGSIVTDKVKKMSELL